ncbi:MAG: carbohydrate binding family 9 domain-containing protein [Bacteroidia bacterium]|nr:carbohydrate binding family 9 domain-containing protein [Bacteroidia bacterium]NNF81299.1 carbohydrate binding family 9 domain-containing protein [Flavobacteriaceae bacterium]NNL79900.1 carbohydrate binding family 9 domain-containing protein [Flavobacteriaceae bacterium]
MNRLHCLVLFCLFFSFLLNAQDRKSLNIIKTDNAPKIDGNLDDDAWQLADSATDFVQFRPEMGVTLDEDKKTTVKMTYDDNAIYVGAYFKDKPDDIQRQFTSRDNFGNSDVFGIILNPNNDAQNDIMFFVFSSGTQADAVSSPDNGEDFGWNAVWDSQVSIVSDGWIIEMKIPYAALRFANEEVQTWGIQFYRKFMLTNNEYSWNPIDRTKGNIGLYHGELRGIKNIEPPTRLIFYPFVSSLQKSYDGDSESEYRVGLDVKYGITENFTLDATLIPDFSQAAFDNVRLNLGPFEQTFSEQRQFFKEGVDLFNKGNLFFSRRVGNAPTGSVDLGDSEEIKDYPDEVKVINALKVSGRTKKGLGVGFFNAITEKTDAVIENMATGEIRKEVVEPLANYNILVIDQQFNRNSSVSLVNTNVMRSGDFRDSNVTGLLFDISNKANKYNASGEVKMSRLNLIGDDQVGYSARFTAAKIYGKYRARAGYSMADTSYDINDLGLQFRNNYSNFFWNASYRIFEPTKRFNNFSIFHWGNLNYLFDPNEYTGNSLGLSVNGQTKSLHWFGGNINTQLGKQYDYFEPRDTANNRFFIYENWLNANAWMETNSAKRFSVEGNAGFGTMFEDGRDLFNYWLGFEPTMRFTDKFRMNYDLYYQNNKGNRGFVTNNEVDIIFGQRDQISMTNSISGSYNFNPLHALTLTFRNYWTTVDYDYDLYSLMENGRLDVDSGYNKENIGFDPDINFMTWNLDLRYAWQFAPGSQLIALYRNQLFNQNNASEDNYSDSLNTLFEQPFEHTFSLRLVYFLDYNNLKGVFKGKRSI